MPTQERTALVLRMFDEGRIDAETAMRMMSQGSLATGKAPMATKSSPERSSSAKRPAETDGNEGQPKKVKPGVPRSYFSIGIENHFSPSSKENG